MSQSGKKIKNRFTVCAFDMQPRNFDTKNVASICHVKKSKNKQCGTQKSSSFHKKNISKMLSTKVSN